MTFLDKMKQILYGHEDLSILSPMERNLYDRLKDGNRAKAISKYDITDLAIYLITLEQNFSEARCAAMAFEEAIKSLTEENERLHSYKDTVDAIICRVNDDDSYLD